MNTYTAHAKRWEHGWELHVDGVGVTQIRTLERAEQQVRDLVETMTDQNASEAAVVILPDLGGLEAEIADTRRDIAAATEAQAQAAARSRTLVAKLRAANLSVSDIGTVLGVSRGRVSQLVKG